MKNKKSFRIITAALFSALAVVTSLVIHIPIPGSMGYLNISDAFSVSAVILLGPLYGTLSAVTGGVLSDIIAGNPFYIPATFVIKILVSVTVNFLFIILSSKKKNIISLIIPCISDVIIMTAGYFLFEYCFISGKASIVGIPFNILQGAVSSVIAIVIIKAANKTRFIQSFERNQP